MAPGAVVVNVARGGALDRRAVEDALASGRLSGLGLDVFWQEPPPPDDPLFDANVTVTAHIGGVSLESYRAMAQVVLDNVERLRAGQPLLNRVA
jgi:phosphoglycerate dehydrogenase-like enzyme